MKRETSIEHARRDDPVNHPAHYTMHPSGIECVTIAEHFGFCLGNAIKYIWRAGLKTQDASDDLKKAAWYINRELARQARREFGVGGASSSPESGAGSSRHALPAPPSPKSGVLPSRDRQTDALASFRADAAKTGRKQPAKGSPAVFKNTSARPFLQNILIGGSIAFTNTAATAAAFAPPADGCFQIAPLGEFPISVTLSQLPARSRETISAAAGTDGRVRVLQVVDADALAALANSAPAQTLVDYEHASFDEDGSTAAAGWLGKPAVRAGGLYGPIRWTNETEITSGRYRYLSPVFAAGESLQWLGGNRFRVTSLIGLAVTNKPNIPALDPLSNRDAPGDENQTTTTPHTTTNTGEPHAPVTHMKEKLIALFGLPADATDEDIFAAASALKTAQDALAGEVLENRKQEAAALCAKHGIADPAKQAEFSKLYLANRQTAQAFLGFLPPKVEGASSSPIAPLTNRYTPKTPVIGAGTGDGGVFLNAARARAKEEKISLPDAIGLTAGEQPALYTAYAAALGKEAAA
jgi:phage I-like protein